jgi:hypothetical protein
VVPLTADELFHPRHIQIRLYQRRLICWMPTGGVFLGRRRQFWPEKVTVWWGVTKTPIFNDKTHIKQISDMLLVLVQWCLDRDNSGEHGP